MHPDIWVVCMDRHSGDLYKIPDVPNTLTRQSSVTNNTPRDPLYGPITYNPARTRPKSMLGLHILSQNSLHNHNFHENRHCVKTFNRDASFIWWKLRCCRRKRLLCFPYPLPIQLGFLDPIWLRFFNSIQPIFPDSIQLLLHQKKIQVIVESHSWEYHICQSVLKII